MKTLFLLIASFFIFKASAQITLETTYTSAATSLYMVDLEISGMKYIRVDRLENNRQIRLYNLDHSLWKTIDLNEFPLSFIAFDDDMDGIPDTTFLHHYDLLYVSENLFDLDPELEFMFTFNSTPHSESYTGIYNENGSVVFAESGVFPGVILNVPQQFRPIYNTPDGTKMILSSDNGDAKVYSLAGTLSLSVASNSNTTEEKYLNIYPNPTTGYTTIEYALPAGVKHGTISIFNSGGSLVKSYDVDDSFNNLNLSNGELLSGNYFYTMSVNGVKLETRKIVVL